MTVFATSKALLLKVVLESPPDKQAGRKVREIKDRLELEHWAEIPKV